VRREGTKEKTSAFIEDAVMMCAEVKTGENIE
jgi:hypothetical protein